MPTAPAPRFSPETLRFLRALKRHNDRQDAVVDPLLSPGRFRALPS